jgi:hypothetical protein
VIDDATGGTDASGVTKASGLRKAGMSSPSCPMLKSDLEVCSIEIKELKNKIDLAIVFSLLNVKCVALSRLSFSMLSKRTPS